MRWLVGAECMQTLWSVQLPPFHHNYLAARGTQPARLPLPP
jgi:hypothetical protein